jgi:hypothetical protein
MSSEARQHALEVVYSKKGVPSLVFNEMLDDCKLSFSYPNLSTHRPTDKLYWAKDMLSYYVLEHPIKYSENLNKGGLPVFSIEEFNCYKGMILYWLITSPNYRGIYKPPIRIQNLCAKSNRCYRLDDRMLHPQLVSKGFKWVVCIPRKRDRFPGLWWQPAMEDSVVLQSGVIVTMM